MRAPQYGSKRAGNRRVKAPDASYAFRGVGKPVHLPDVATVRAEPTLWGSRAVGLAGPNAALPSKRIKYRSPAVVRYSDGQLGAPVKLRLNHKSASWVEGVRVDVFTRTLASGEKVQRENPYVTKPYSVVKSSQTVKLRGTP